MKRLIGILLCCFLLLPLAGVSAAAEETGAKRVPAPIYYQTFENCTVEDFMGEDVLIKTIRRKIFPPKSVRKTATTAFSSAHGTRTTNRRPCSGFMSCRRMSPIIR